MSGKQQAYRPAEVGDVYFDTDPKEAGREFQVIRFENEFSVCRVISNNRRTAQRMRSGIAREAEDRRGKIFRIHRQSLSRKRFILRETRDIG